MSLVKCIVNLSNDKSYNSFLLEADKNKQPQRTDRHIIRLELSIVV